MQIRINQPEHFCQKGQRDHQEDSFCPEVATPQTSFFAVCDGVGGRARGEVASSLVCKEIERIMRPQFPQNGKMDVADALALVNRLYDVLFENRAISDSMATTLTFMAITNQGMLLVHLGDSRIYQCRKGEGVIFHTKDHSMVNDMIDRGQMTEQQAETCSFRNVITKCLFVAQSKKDRKLPSIYLINNIKAGDVFMLCSDGVYGELSKTQLGCLLTEDVPLSTRKARLAEVCLDSHDNNTAYLIEVAEVDGVDPNNSNVCYALNRTVKQSWLDKINDFFS